MPARRLIPRIGSSAPREKNKTIMQITGFRSESQELVLDVEQLPGAVAVNRESGQVALRGELANGTPIPATVSADKVVDLETASQDDGRIEVKLAFQGDDGATITLSLGTTDQVDAARAWIDEVKSTVAPRERRPRLNPTIDPNQAVAVPSIIEPAASGDSDAPAAAVAPPAAPSAPVEIPSGKLAIDADLEKELDAAMAGQMSEPTAPPVGAQTPSHQSTVTELPESEDQLESGTKLKAKVQDVTSENVFCDVGFRSPGLLPARQFPQGKQPRVGEEFLVVVEKYDPENSVILVNLPKATRRAKGNWEELTVGQIVDCMVTKTNKGGLEVTIGALRAFLPASQVDLGFSPVLETYVGKKLTVQITEVNPTKRNLVVSRRVILIEERKEAAVTFWQQVEVGQQYTGTVKTIKDYGAFVDLGGADGFLHIGEMSWTRVKHPSEVLQEGAAADVVVLSLDREKQKIGLGMRQLAHNPWAGVEDRYPQGKSVSGRITRVSDFGAFVELETGVEGLIHISELDHQRVRKVSDVVNVGQEVEMQVLEVLPDRQRISLSLKALKQKPEKPKDEDMAPSQGQQYERKRKEPLRGGTSRDGGGGLFGNPGDFRK
jgi:predicted RNA-binding protein with RPS1 domain